MFDFQILVDFLTSLIEIFRSIYEALLAATKTKTKPLYSKIIDKKPPIGGFYISTLWYNVKK